MLDGFLNRKKENRVGHQSMLSAYLDGELTARQRAKLENELNRNSALKAELDDLRRTVQMVRSLPTLAVPRSFTLDPAVYGRVKPRRLYLYPIMRAATVAAMLVFVFLFAGDLFLGSGAMAPTQDVEMMAVETTRVVEKELAIPEAAEMEQMGDEAVEEPAAELLGEAPTGEDSAEERQLTAPAEEVVEKVVEMEEEVVLEAESALAPTAEMPAAEVGEGDAAYPPPLAEPADGGVSAGGALPTATAMSSILPTPSPSETTPPPAVEEAAEPLPTRENTPEPAETVWEPEPARHEDKGIDWLMIGKLGVGVLALGLLVVTALARRFNW